MSDREDNELSVVLVMLASIRVFLRLCLAPKKDRCRLEADSAELEESDCLLLFLRGHTMFDTTVRVTMWCENFLDASVLGFAEKDITPDER